MVRASLSSLILGVAFILVGCGAPAVTNSNTNTEVKAVPPVATGATLPPVTDDVFCTEEYAPVCAKRQVQCITTPCDPVEQTYPNRCYAQKDGAFDIKEGECAFE